MKKDYRCIFNGFTMAEILISLAIAMVVATALVPVLGTKKVKHPISKVVHGVAACYYDASGNIHYDVAESQANAPVRGQVRGNYCSFQIPRTNYLNVTAIGSGGRSTANTLRYSGNVDSQNSETNFAGSLRIDNNFQFDIDESSKQEPSLPSKIRRALDEWARVSPGQISATYTNIRSPLGAAGTSKCMPKFSPSSCNVANPSGRWYEARPAAGYANATENSNCFWYQLGKGSNSGRGRMISSLTFPLKGSSVINVEETTTRTRISVTNDGNERWVELPASGNGTDATCRDNNPSCTNGSPNGADGTCSSSFNGCSSFSWFGPNNADDTGIENLQSRTCSDSIKPAVSGSANYTGRGAASNAYGQGAIDWFYRRPLMRTVIASAKGDYGDEISQNYENLTGTLELHPAANSGNNNPSFVVYQGQRILSANSKPDAGTTNTLQNVNINEMFPEAIVQATVPDNKGHFNYISKLKGSGFNNLPILNCETTQSCPGYGGTGIYMRFKNAGGLEVMSLVHKVSNTVRYEHYHDFGTDVVFRGNAGCLETGREGSGETDTLTALPGISGVVFADACKGKYRTGGRGAIIVIW